MKLGPILAALGGGLAGLGAQQGGAMGGLSAMSPILAMLLNKKKKKKGEDITVNQDNLPGAATAALARPPVTLPPIPMGPMSPPGIPQGMGLYGRR